MVVARMDPANATVEMLSVPRDLWVDLAGTGDRGRVNAAYNDGAQSLVDTLQDALDIPIHHYVEVDFAGFKGLVDALGGIPMYFDRAVHDRRSGLDVRRSGCHTLDGVQALAFARSRNLTYRDGTRWVTDPTGDLGRITRQQVFIRHAMQKVSKLGLGDLDSMRVLVGVAVNNVTVDDSLSSGDLIRLGRKFRAFDASTMVTHRLETTAFTTSGGAQVVRLDAGASTSALEIFRGRASSSSGRPASEAPLTPQMVTVDVMNTTETPGLARQAADALAAGGFRIGTVDNAPPVTRTVVRHGAGAERHAELVAERISPSPEVSEDPTLAAGAVEVDLAGSLGSVEPAPSTAAPATVAAGGVATTSVNTPEPTVGVSIGDPPAGIRCV
jgi:LCP family protein required for cell wall assembly